MTNYASRAMRRIALLLAAALLAVLVAVPVVAAATDAPPAEDETTEEGTTDEGTDEAPVDVGDPAVEVDVNPVAEENVPAWTYRYLIPTLIVLTVVVVAFTVIQYFNRVVKARYEPIE